MTLDVVCVASWNVDLVARIAQPLQRGQTACGIVLTTEPLTSRPAISAFMTAMRAEFTRLIWPAPTPTVARSRA